ncbi:MAG TPA: hypothetical protein DHW11_00950 [Gemmatimonadetes bacterium]|nr:hypothetical protein [Gemmatimonadota bacterium]
MSDMKDKRGKGILLLLLLINLTACQTWRSASLGALIPAQVVEQVESHPSTTIRIVSPDLPGLMVDSPSVEGDQLVGVVGGQLFSTPLAEITTLQVRKLDVGKTLLYTLASLFVAMGVACGLETLKGNECSIE